MGNEATVERRFLLKRSFPWDQFKKGVELSIGFLGIHGSHEVVLGIEGSQTWVSVHNGKGDTVSPIPLEAGVFQSLWAMTEGMRLTKMRYRGCLHGIDVIVDSYGGVLAPLRLGSVSLPARTQLPLELKKYFGREVDLRGEYAESRLACHGLPPMLDGSIQAGALPFLFKDGILHVVLVTSSSGQKWLVPKGRLERGMTMEEVALMEAAEEAGAIGALEPGGGEGCVLADGRVLQLFPLRVSTLLPVWPERQMRRRVVLPIYRAFMRIGDPGLERCIREMSRKLVG